MGATAVEFLPPPRAGRLRVPAECRLGSRVAGPSAELSEVSGLFLDGKPQSGEVSVPGGRLRSGTPGQKTGLRCPGRQRAGRIEGFVACSPCQDGRTWVIETYRQRPDAVRGTIPFLMHQVMQVLRNEGVEQVSLCLIPGLRCRQALPGDSRMTRWGLVLASQYFNLVFDTTGAYHFKSRFRPRFENRYLCVRPRMNLFTAVAFVRLLGVLRLDLGKLCRQMVRRWQKRSSRATLGRPRSKQRRGWGLGIRDWQSPRTSALLVVFVFRGD